MPYPFPGMNPWLEHPGLWPDVHNRMIASIADDLGPRVAPRYIVRLEERTYLAEGWQLELVGCPDVTISGPPGRRERLPLNEEAHVQSAEHGIAVTIPIPDRILETYLEIRFAATREVVTVLELLSPTNKVPGEGRRIYLEKRLRLAGTPTGLVEVDLLRAGDPMPFQGARTRGDYRILIRGGSRSSRATLLPFGVRDPIPVFRIPLERGDDWPELDLGLLLHDLHDRARYDLSVDYSGEPIPPLSGPDRAWARKTLRGKGRSPRRR